MKKILLCLVILLGILAGCKEVQPAEQAATIANRDYTFCGFCGGWFVYIDTTLYRAEIPPAFAKDNNKVLIRFEKDQRLGYKEGRWIILKSIRQQ